MAIIGETGIEELSLRDVARRLGVSHQAPYKHFPSRDHLLAEIVSRAFAAFAQHLDARPRSQNPHEDLAAMGRAYLDYAREHPFHYPLMPGEMIYLPEKLEPFGTRGDAYIYYFVTTAHLAARHDFGTFKLRLADISGFEERGETGVEVLLAPAGAALVAAPLEGVEAVAQGVLVGGQGGADPGGGPVADPKTRRGHWQPS